MRHFVKICILRSLLPNNLNKKLSIMEKKKFESLFDQYCADNGFKLSKKRPENSSRILDLMTEVPTKKHHKVKEEKEEEVITLPPPKLEHIPVKTFQDYALDEDVVFIKRLEETGKLADSYIRELPSMKEVLSYISKLSIQPLWYKTCQDSIINSKTLKFPNIPVLTRAYIRDFLRTPLKGETPCNNPACESMRLGNFRIRALTIEGSTWCFLCHLFLTNKLYFESLNRKKDNSRVYQIHWFMVQVNIEGEYRLDKTLMGDNDVRGIFGPFPLYNCYNYAPCDLKNGCKGWIESDCMVFRLSQTMS